ncbi:MAG: hypothetical protein U1C74_22245, partial [Phenylobacterium sp.]|nr:hypothetical protein [Phenylobacterium sp.]
MLDTALSPATPATDPDAADPVGAADTPTRFVESRGRTLAYRAIGAGQAVVLCNRFRGVMDDWDPAFLDALAGQGFQVVVFDHSGLGRSTGQADYDPAALAAERAQYTLVAADGTRYEIVAAQGVSAIEYADGVRLMVSDSGVSAPNGDLLRFVSGEGGRIGAVVQGNGDVFTYEYDAQGRLIAARSLSA